MKKIILFFLAIIFSLNGLCQVTFQKEYGDLSGEDAKDIAFISGGYIILGVTSSFGMGLGNVYLIKINFSGDILWTKIYSTNDLDSPKSIHQTSDGGYIITGLIQNFTTLETKLFVIKTDSVGDIMWSKTYFPMNSIIAYGIDIQETQDGGFIILGSANYTGNASDILLIKTDSLGNVIWNKKYGGTYTDNSSLLVQTGDGGYAIVGHTGNFGAGSSDIYLIKTDTVGTILWNRVYGGPGIDLGLYMQQTSDSGFIIGGWTTSYGAGNEDMYLIKTAGNGDILWSKTYGGINTDAARCLSQTTDGGYIVCGASNSFGAGFNDGVIFRINMNGDTLWTRIYTDTVHVELNAIIQTLDGGYITTGAKDVDILVIKMDTNGNGGCIENSVPILITSPAFQSSIPTTIESITNISPIPITFTTDTGGTMLFSCITGTLELDAKNRLLIYPNPTMSELRIENAELKIKEIEIYSSLGEKVFSQIPNLKSQISIDVSQLPPGIYFITITDQAGNKVTKKVVKM